MSRFIRRAVSLAALASLTGCGAPQGEAPTVPASTVKSLQGAAPSIGKVEYIMPTAPWFKPAHRPDWNDPKPLSPLKADQYDDIRAANPQNYAITVPPANIATVRPMVEWEPMKSIVLQWPSYYLSSSNASATVASIAKFSATVAEVWIVTEFGGENAIRAHLANAGMPQNDIDTKVRVMETTVDSIWFIDSGPVPLIDTATNTMAFSDFRYYHERAYDDGVSTALGRHLPNFGYDVAATVYRMPLSIEGGTFQATTDGVCITGNRQLFYMSCDQGGCDNSLRTLALDQVQNHPLAQEVRTIWAQYMGCKDTIITNSITDDGTGHIDMYLKIVDDDTVMIGDYRAPFQNGTQQQLNAERMNANAAFLEAYVKPNGGKFDVVRLVMPGHRSSNQGSVPFTYINSTFINGLNLWPATEFSDWTESRDLAQSEWEAAMPDWNHQYIDATELSFWSGAIHCITRTIPDLPTSSWVGDGTCDGGTCAAPDGGYDGECQPNGLTQQICWGPQWECECNDCTRDCSEPPDQCPQGLTYTGCCVGDQTHFCDQGSYEVFECENGCGWSAGAGFYDCAGGQSGAQAGASDPSGLNPRDCNAIFCEPNCTGKSCGDDGCGGSCGTCGDGEECTAAGQCAVPCDDECTAGEAGCEGDVAWSCGQADNGCLVKVNQDCAADGKICTSGACFDDPNPGTGAETGADAGGSGTPTVDGGTPVSPTPGGSSEGCATGPNAPTVPGLILVVFGALVVALRRRTIA